MSGSQAYKDAGVDTEAGASLVERIKPAVASTKRAGANANLGGFGGLFDLAACGFQDPVLVAANDGVGTKLKIAIETGLHATVGIDLVAMCANDLVVQGAEPLFFLDYFATGALDVDEAAGVVDGIAEGCRQAGCALIGGETAEMPSLYAKGDYDLAGFCVGAVERSAILPSASIAEGDVILGLEASGFHSNGYSLIRKTVDESPLTYADPAPFENARTLGEFLLTPTRIYVKSVLDVQRKTSALKGLAHITGGGPLENIPRVLPKDLAAEINFAKVPLPAEMAWLAGQAKLSAHDMLATFNCGIGMVVIVSADVADQVLEAFAAAGERVHRLGQLVIRSDDPVMVQGLQAF